MILENKNKNKNKNKNNVEGGNYAHVPGAKDEAFKKLETDKRDATQ